MWPCNSIITAFVWFVTLGKWTQTFQCGCCRILFKVSEVSAYHWMESQREWVRSSQGVSKTQVLWWTWGQWCCPQRAPGRPEQDSEGSAISSRPRKCLLVKKLQHHPRALTLELLCFPVGSVSISKEDSQAMKAAGTWDVPSLTWGAEEASPGAWSPCSWLSSEPPKPSSPQDSRGVSVLALLLTAPTLLQCSRSFNNTHKQELASQQNQEWHEFLQFLGKDWLKWQ